MSRIQTRTDELMLQELLEKFLRSRKSQNLTDKTIKNYKARCEKFLRFVGDIAAAEVSEEIVQEYIAFIQSTGVAQKTVNSDLSAVRTFLYYGMKFGYIKKFEIKLLKVDRVLKEVYSEKELQVLLKKPNLKKCDFTEYKVWVFENYLMATGNRLGSCLEIKIGDIDFAAGAIILRKTKSRKQQIIPIPSGLVNILEEYIEIRGGGADDYLFCSASGLLGNDRTLQQQVAAYNRKRGIDKTSIHLFRHTFATMYLKNGGDIYSLSKLLGHGSVAVTENYIQELPIEYWHDKVEQFNPLDKFIKKSKIKL